jgi:hypothetical protein
MGIRETNSTILDGEGHSDFLLMRCMAMVVSKSGIPRVTCSIKNPSMVVLCKFHSVTSSVRISHVR